MDRVIILMSTYQGEKYLAAQLNSILAQSMTNWCVVAADDGSVDSTVLMLSAYANEYPGRFCVDKNAQNLGAAKSFLTLLKKEAEAQRSSEDHVYYMFCDQDDIWHPDKIEKTLTHMKKLEKKYGAEEPCLAFTDNRPVDDMGNPIAESFYEQQHLNVNNWNFSHLLMENLCIGCTMMVNQALANLVTDIPEHSKMHDWWIALLASSMGHTAFLREATLDYRQHGNNVVGASDFGNYVVSRMKNREEQKKRLQENYDQAAEFLKIYEPILPTDKRKALQAFIKLYGQNPLAKRANIIKNGFGKSGVARNIGLFINI